MHRFTIKHTEVPLFDCVEANDQENWRAAFADPGSPLEIQIDDQTLSLLSDELEFEADEAIGSASKYNAGAYRPKSAGIGGSTLGNFAELVVFLRHKTSSAGDIQRVFSYRRSGSNGVQGLFPQPDFILRTGNTQFAVEVKGTEAFDFLGLSRTPKSWLFLQPCERVDGCRRDALHQLCYTDGTFAAAAHQLVLNDGKIVPFPTDEGLAEVLLVHDGRTASIRDSTKFRTPPLCRNAAPSRSCWNCIALGSAGTLVSMRNSPGRLGLAGGGRESPMWLRAYRRWGEALRARNTEGLRAARAQLSTENESWLSRIDGKASAPLATVWTQYMREVATQRGLFSGDGPAGINLAATVPLDAERRGSPLSLDEMAELLRSGLDFQTVSATRSDIGSLSISVRDSRLHFNLLSPSWFADQEIRDTQSAEQLAGRLIGTALGLNFEGYARTAPWRVPLRPATVRVGAREMTLGWVANPEPAAYDSWSAWMKRVQWPFDAPWLQLLLLGDPRVELRVYPHGRSELMIPRQLWPTVHSK